jgi:hypothetical protein
MRCIKIFRPFCVVFLYAVVLQASAATFNASIAGRVLDNQGKPRRSQVHAFRLSVQDGQIGRFPACDTETDSDGQFLCEHAEPGNYILQALPSPGSADGKAAERSNPAIAAYYPGVSDLDAAIPVKVKNAQRGWFDIRLPKAEGFTISGPLKSIPQRADLRLEALGNDIRVDTEIHVLCDSQKQSFHAEHVPNGHYILSAVWREGMTPHRMAAEVTVQSSNLERVDLHEEVVVRLHGSLSGDQADRVAILLLYREDNSLPKAVAQVEHGTFTLPPVPPGKYYFALPVHSEEFIACVGRGDVTSDGPAILVTEQSSFTDVRVITGSPGSVLTGSVPSVTETGKRARVIAEHEGDGRVSTVLSDEQGRFSISGLLPGDYSLFAWPESEDPAYRSPQVLRRLEKFATTASVDKSAQTQIGDLPLLHPAVP